LRTTAAWRQYQDVRVIPERYGTLTAELLQYDSGRRLFVWANHPSVLISEVRVDGQRIVDWEWFNAPDSTGKPVTFVRLGQPADDFAAVTARGTGKRHARTGKAITSPADLLWDVLYNLAGMTAFPESAFDAFRVETARLGIAIAGSIEAEQSVQAQLAEICGSIGAVFAATMPGVARVFPGGELDAYSAARIDKTYDLSANVAIDDICNALVVRYDYALDTATRTLELEAPDSIAEYGRRERTLDARWISSTRLAFEIGTRLLQQEARPQWHLSASGIKAVVKLGQTVTFAHPHSPYTGTALVSEALLEIPTYRSDVGVRVAVGQVPRVRLVRTGAQLEPQQYAGAQVATQGDQRVITLTDEVGAPLGNVSVVLDGQYTRFSDAGGRVTFPVSLMPPGEHVLEIETADGTLTLKVLVQ
jgi:hypothetical protein